MLSKRMSARLSANQAITEQYQRYIDDAFEPTNNPQGYINFGTAENYLLWDLIHTKTQPPPELGEHDAHYLEAHGKPNLRETLARFLSERAGNTIIADDIIVTAGAISSLEILAFALFDEGDGVLVPTPYYQGFDFAFKTRANVKIINVETLAANNFVVSIKTLKHQLELARQRGTAVKALLICSPSNPTGVIYPAALLRDLCAFCRGEGLQFIVDEIYAESRNHGERFFSALKLNASNTHVVYGLSKDFGLAGLGVGVLHSRQKPLIRVAAQLAHFARVSNHTQTLVERLLDSEPWIDASMRDYRARLTHAREATSVYLKRLNIPFIPAKGGIFIFMNLSKHLRDQCDEEEAALCNRIFDECKIIVSPGQTFHCPQPGWFRLCYSLRETYLLEGLRRLENLS